ncbi:MAG: hypothetical protein J5818_02500, partial [Eggerthellaceae bacterium]|nr:hypothetical protein [Eggerthellaceae bacterium]
MFDQRLYKAYEKLYRQQWKKTSSDEVFEPDEQEPNGRVQHFDYEWNADGTSMLEHAWSSDKDKSFESDSYYRHTYDEAGNLLFDQWYTDASLADVWFQTEYRYDSAGNEIRMTATRFDEFGVVYDRECGY